MSMFLDLNQRINVIIDSYQFRKIIAILTRISFSWSPFFHNKLKTNNHEKGKKETRAKQNGH